jgi:DNA polymerase/3'-5' exonuclease PolX
MSTTANRMPWDQAVEIAVPVLQQIQPHCEIAQFAGSMRRETSTVGDIEIVCVPKPCSTTPLFRDGLAAVVEQWPKVRGELPCRYTQRLLPCGMKLDLFMVDPDGWGLQLAIRTGSARWSHEVLARAWVRAGYRSEGGLLRRGDGKVVPVRTESELFQLIGLPWVHPRDREVAP